MNKKYVIYPKDLVRPGASADELELASDLLLAFSLIDPSIRAKIIAFSKRSPAHKKEAVHLLWFFSGLIDDISDAPKPQKKEPRKPLEDFQDIGSDKSFK
jgi:hypothetical protein